MAEITEEDPFAKYQVKPTTTSGNSDWSQYEVKPLPKAQPTYTDIRNIHTTPQQTYSPVTDPNLRQQIQQQGQQQVNHQKQELSNRLTQIKSYLKPENAKELDNAINIATTREPDNLREVSKEEQDHYNFMQTPVGKTLGAVAYLGSKATKGALQVAKGAAHYAGYLEPNAGLRNANEIMAGVAFDKSDKNTNYGLTNNDINRYDENKITSNLGGLAEFAPAAAASAPTGGATLFLQGAGQAQEQLEKAQRESGVDINPLVKEAFIGGTGIVNKFLMHDLGNSVFNKLPAGLRGDITASISANAIKEASGKELTGEAFNNLLQKGATEWADKVAKTGVNALQGTSKAALDLSALATSNFLLKKGVDATTDTPVFNENAGDLAQQISDIATKTAPLFGAAGEVRNLTKLTPYSSYKNSVVESLMADPSEANVAKVKQDLVDHNNAQEPSQQWNRDEVDATIQHIDKIADIARKLPRGIPQKKVGDAVDLVNGRDELKQQLADVQKQRSQMDESVNEIPSEGEKFLIDKIDQANDKLKDIATGKKTTYSKGTGDEEGLFFKTVGGKKEEIPQSRYELENLERTSHAENSIEQAPSNQQESPVVTEPITDEQRKAQNDETDAKIKAFQEKFPDKQVDPLEDLPESVVRTFDRVDNDLPTDPVAVQEASDWLYNKYKQLTAMKQSDTRMLTTEQIDAMQEQLGEDITLLENHKQKYHGEEPTGQAAQAEQQTQPAEQAVSSTNESTGNPIEQNQKVNEQTTETANPELPTNPQQESATVAQENSTANSEANVGQANEEPVVEKTKSSPKPKIAEAIKNENIKAKAEKAGIELDDHVGKKRTKEVVDAEAEKELKSGYDSHELVRKILEEKYIPSDTEGAILAKHTATVENNYNNLTKRLETDGATMSKREFDDLSAEYDQASKDYQDALNADVKAGTAQARGFGARRFNVKNDFSLGQMIKNKRAALGGEKLSSEQLSEVTKRFNEIEEANKKLQERVSKLEGENARIKAEKAIKRIQEGEARIARKAVTKEALAEDRKRIAEEFSAKLKAMRQSGALNSVGKATYEFLQAAAPYVAKMVRNLALEGVTEIKDVVARVKEELDLHDLSDRDVTDMIAGNYSERTPTKKELSDKILDLKMQAKLIGQIEDAESGLKKAKGTKAESKASNNVKSLRARLKELTKDETSLQQSKTATQNRIKELERRIAEGDFSKPESKVVPDQELLDLRRKADRLKQEYQLQLAKDELANRSKIEKAKDNLLNIASLPRALKASLDFSAVLRQGLFATAGHPKEALTAFKEMFRQTVSEEKYKNWIADLKHHPVYELMQKSDLYLSDKSDPKLLAREEEFTSNLADKIPGIGKLIAASERAYTGYLNVLRAGVFTREAQNLIRKGYTFENNPEQFKALAKVVNVLTGRGDIPEFLGGKQPKLLSSALFSPRFMAARIQTLYLWADPRLPKEAKILAAKDIGATLAAGATIISLAALAGLKIQTDPRSSNFLKIQDKQEHGTTYYDILGGLPQYIRFLAQQITGKKKPANDKGMITLGSKKYGSPTRLTEAARFIRGKFSPVVGSATNLMEGKDVVGQPYHFWPNVPQEFVPLPLSDVYDAYKIGGITGSLKAFLPSQFGIGTSSYDPNAKKK